MTTSIARLVSTRMRDRLPLRLGYIARAFRFEEPQEGRMREFTQAGMECIGLSDRDADAEMPLYRDGDARRRRSSRGAIRCESRCRCRRRLSDIGNSRKRIGCRQIAFSDAQSRGFARAPRRQICPRERDAL